MASERDESTERIIGRLEGLSTSLQQTLDRVLTGQEKFNQKLDLHAEEDRHTAATIHEALGAHRDRMTKLEATVDAVDSHGDAILSLEKRLDAREEADKVYMITHKANIRWSRGVVGFAGVIAMLFGAAAGNGAEKFAKWLLSVLPKAG